MKDYTLTPIALYYTLETELYLLLFMLIFSAFYVSYFVFKDEGYLCDDEKKSYYKLIWFLPVIGAYQVLNRLNEDTQRYGYVMLVVYFLIRWIVYYSIAAVS
jgi:hypothetical protein